MLSSANDLELIVTMLKYLLTFVNLAQENVGSVHRIQSALSIKFDLQAAA